MFRKILVGLDGSDVAQRAFERALDLAVLCSAELHVLSVEEKLPAYASTVGEVNEEERFEHRYFLKVQADARLRAAERGVPFRAEVRPGHAADALVRKARNEAFDLIVIGHTGHSRLHQFFLGSTADRVVEHASCAVLVVR
jgi:nucleotide-binding universal stress UspA family protein